MGDPCLCYCMEKCCDDSFFEINHSNFLGPLLGEVIVNLLSFLCEDLAVKLGIRHDPCIDPCCYGPTPTVGGPLDLECWLENECKKLAKEVCEYNCDTEEPGVCPPTQSMLQARKFVLNRLAELMEKKEELEMCCR